MEIKTKFNIGQDVWVIHNNSTYKKKICPTCDREGVVMICSLLGNIGGGKYPTICCPQCYGKKMISGEKINKHDIEATKIKGIKISIRENSGIHISYKIPSDNKRGELSYPENEHVIFETEQAALNMCNKLNGLQTDNDSTAYRWHDVDDYPKVDVPIIVMDKEGKEHDNHRWVGHTYYEYQIRDDGDFDGYRSDVDIVKWRYADEENH